MKFLKKTVALIESTLKAIVEPRFTNPPVTNSNIVSENSKIQPEKLLIREIEAKKKEIEKSNVISRICTRNYPK